MQINILTFRKINYELFSEQKSTSAFKVFALPFSMNFSHVTFTLMEECAGRGRRHPGTS